MTQDNRTETLLQRRVAWDYTTVINTISQDLLIASISVTPDVLDRVMLNIGLSREHLDSLTKVLPSSWNEALQQQSMRLEEFIDVDTPLLCHRLRSLHLGNIHEHTSESRGFSTKFNLTFITYLVKCYQEGNQQFLLHLGFSYDDLTMFDGIGINDAIVLAQSIDIAEKSLLRFTDAFWAQLLVPAQEKAELKKLQAEVVQQGITQTYAQSYLNLQKTQLGQLRDFLKCKRQGGVTERKIKKRLDGPNKAEVYRIYERDYGLYTGHGRYKPQLLLDIAKQFNVTFTCIADAVAEREEFYSWLHEVDASFEFAQSFYGVPERLRSYFSNGTDRPLSDIEACLAAKSITVQHILSQQTANERLRLHNLAIQTELPLSELYKFVRSRCKNGSDKDSVDVVFKMATRSTGR
ncbi:DUF2857 domain-containing protein [Vibrio tubiashii]|uniref:DUF2857 domain-containing protein n=1 Tax=Vibrio tubiashii TaxID=29498 RepID=UPI001EFD0452|nr:DUF2857 domain-containing protein [Vibrio tubiashii]MCG9576648.1 DUF2857 domain-containing protein [Vibrio tubiashii]